MGRKKRRGYPSSGNREPQHTKKPYRPQLRDDDRSQQGRSIPDVMRRMFFGTTAEITIALHTRNSESTLEANLALLRNQAGDHEIEIIAVDFGSTDRTPLILRSRGIRTIDVRSGTDVLEKIIEIAEGDVVVFLRPDSTPLNEHWCQRLTSPLFGDESMMLAHGRLIIDAGVSPYPRGLVNARAHVSGKQSLLFVRPEENGARYLPPTNFAIRKSALRILQPGLEVNPEKWETFYAKGFKRCYLGDAVAILKGEETAQELAAALTSRTGDKPRIPLLSKGLDLFQDLRELSEGGDLPRGQRGDAYLEAINLRFGSLLQMQWPLKKRSSS
jgi:hypothetical protein